MNISLDRVLEEYYDNRKSIHQIAEENNTYPNKIRRILIRSGYTLRDKSEAQSEAIKSGRTEHPTKGKNLSLETKSRISESVSNSWTRLSKTDLKKRKKLAKDQWDKKPILEKENMRKKAHKAIRQTAQDGSRLEKSLRMTLIENGYAIQYHHKGLTANEKLEVDIYIPRLKLAIEIDGPSHFLPVWGQASLNKQKRADMEKYGLLTSSGVKVLRVKVYKRNITQKTERDFLGKVLDYLDNVDRDNQKDLVELEIK